jgi:hypothetical protein
MGLVMSVSGYSLNIVSFYEFFMKIYKVNAMKIKIFIFLNKYIYFK